MPLSLPPKPGIDPGASPETPKLQLPYQNEIFRSAQTASRNEDRTSSFDTWNTDRTPSNTGRLMTSLQPAINQSVRKYIKNADPVAMAHAKRLVIDALPRYDSSQTQIETFIDRQIQPIVRWQSRRNGITKLPDKVKMDATAIGNATRELERETGRPPSIRQIADYTGMPIGKIEKIRKFDRTMLAGSHEVGQDDSGTISVEDQGVFDDQKAADSWLRLVRDDLSPIDQLILEHTTGIDGADVLSNTALAKKLKLSPGAISQRKARIQLMLDKEDDLSPFQ